MKCKDCGYLVKQINGYRCMYPEKMAQRNVINIKKTLDCCPLKHKKVYKTIETA